MRPLVPKGSLKFLTAYYHLPFFSLPPIRIPAKRTTAVNAEIQIGESTHIQCHLITPDSFRTMNTIVRMDTMPSPPCFVLLFIIYLRKIRVGGFAILKMSGALFDNQSVFPEQYQKNVCDCNADNAEHGVQNVGGIPYWNKTLIPNV